MLTYIRVPVRNTVNIIKLITQLTKTLKWLILSYTKSSIYFKHKTRTYYYKYIFNIQFRKFFDGKTLIYTIQWGLTCTLRLHHVQRVITGESILLHIHTHTERYTWMECVIVQSFTACIFLHKHIHTYIVHNIIRGYILIKMTGTKYYH